MYRLGYNTNGLAHHRLHEALELVADLGYEALAITPDVGQLDPFRLNPGDVADIARRSADLGLELAIETGARFVLDPRRKHYPSLLETDADARRVRVDFLVRCVDLAADLGADVVSLWAGVAPDGSTGDPSTLAESGFRAPSENWDRLIEGLGSVLRHAAERGVLVGFEPEPGMFIERPSGYVELVQRMGPAGDSLGLTLDVGHLLVTGDLPVKTAIFEHRKRLVHVHLDDIAGGKHDHRMFGEGDLDLAETLGALIEVGFDGMAAVELSRDSHRGAQAAELAMQALRTALLEP